MTILFTLVVVGFFLWLFNRLATAVDPTIKIVVNAVVLLGVLWFLLSVLGVVPPIPGRFWR